MNAHRTLAHCLTLAASAAILETSFGQVEEAWVDVYNGPAGMNDRGEAIALDSAGGVYVAGTTFQEVQPDYFVPRFLTIRYEPDGTRMWTRTYAGDFGGAAATAAAVDGRGHVVVAGSANLGEDWAVVKYDASGSELWTRVHQTSSVYLTEPDDLAVDAAGGIYLTGSVGASVTAALTVKYDAAGTFQWARQYAGPAGDGSAGLALAVDGAGNVYVAGTTLIAGVAGELSVVKYDATGTLQWLRTIGTPFAPVAVDRANDIALDGAGNIVASGYASANWITSMDVMTVKYDPEGNLLWSTVYDSPFALDDSGSRLAVDGEDNIVVVGYSETGWNDADALTLKYDGQGTLLWAQRYGGAETHPDYASAVAVDTTGNVYVTGETDPIGGEQYFTIRYDPAGERQWEMLYAGELSDSSAADLALGADGSVFVTGESWGFATNADVATVKYTQPQAGVPGDLDGDGVVGTLDLLVLLAAWGPCPAPPAACPADLDGDGMVGVTDLLVLLAEWG